MLVGYMAGRPFLTSSLYTKTFDDYTRSSGSRWATHNIIGAKPVQEYLGPELEQISFKIQLRLDHGVVPEQELKELRKLRDQGKNFTLVIGGKLIGRRWILKSIAESTKYWSKLGTMLSVDVEVELEEYEE